jgi:UDP-N-acetylmuramoylalanine--D-glutamate ligase
LNALLVGFAVTNQAVARTLVRAGHSVAVVDDGPGDAVRIAAAAAGVELIEAPDALVLERLVGAADAVYPSPGVPDRHPVFAAALRRGVPIRSEFDLARELDSRPLLAVTGTDGKTTVTTWVEAMLEASGVRAVSAGNVELPLVAAIEDPAADVFVVEASSFRLAHTERFEPAVATWLNFAPDHLDAHSTLEAYETAKARIWLHQESTAVAVGNVEDPVVAGHLSAAVARTSTFGLAAGDYRVVGGTLVGPEGDLLAVRELWRGFPHDVANALAATATALAGGATVAGVRASLRSFAGLPHRVTLIGEADGVRYYDDSKATAPHATLAALQGFVPGPNGSGGSVVLIAGGRNKGLDLGVLRQEAGRVRAVVAIGESAADVERAFAGARDVVTATSMTDAVDAARALARPGDVILLSPGCASFDWYGSYAERGDDFTRLVRDLIGAGA